MRRFVAAILLAGLSCGIAAAGNVPLPPPRPLPYADAAGSEPPAIDVNDLTAEPSDCRRRLETIADVTPVTLIIGPGGCGGDDMVWLETIRLNDNTRIPVAPPPMLRCPMAAALADWIREDVATHVALLGAKLRSVDNFGDYECRPRNRLAGAKLSEHGKGNAIDIRGFSLDNGRIVDLSDVTVSADFRTALRASACERFTTVLGPGSDAYHNGHIHLDRLERHNGYSICEWDVNEPPPAGAAVAVAGVPLPVPKPENLRAQAAP